MTKRHHLEMAAVAMVVFVAALSPTVPAGAAEVSLNIAGYRKVESSASIATARFVVPMLTCTGVDFEQSGNEEGVMVFNDVGERSTAQIQLLCVGAYAEYSGGLLVNGVATLVPHEITPGDVVRVIASVSPAGTEVSMRDLTAGWVERRSGSGGNAAEAFIGAIAAGCATDGCLAVAQFSPVRVTAATIDGASLVGTTSSVLTANNGRAEVKASPLSPSGKAFTLKWRWKCAPAVNERC